MYRDPIQTLAVGVAREVQTTQNTGAVTLAYERCPCWCKLPTDASPPYLRACLALLGESARLGFSIAYAAPEVISAYRAGERSMVAEVRRTTKSSSVIYDVHACDRRFKQHG